LIIKIPLSSTEQRIYRESFRRATRY